MDGLRRDDGRTRGTDDRRDPPPWLFGRRLQPRHEQLLRQLPARGRLLPASDHHRLTTIRAPVAPVRLPVLHAPHADGVHTASEGDPGMTNPDAPLAGKVAYVTGAARGQG